MALPRPIAPSQVDAKSPADEDLFESIKADLDDLDARAAGGGSASGGGSSFKINGYLAFLCDYPFTVDQVLAKPRYRLDGAIYSGEATLQGARLLVEDMGDGGTLEADLLRYTKPNTLITGLERQFKAPISSVGRVGSSLSTQSIARSTAQIATQSIARWKPSLSITSIVPLGLNLFRINLSGTPDDDYKVNDYVTISSAANSANNGNYLIARNRDDNANNVVIYNPAGVAQSTAAGSLDLVAWKFTYVNPVSAEFAAGENATLSGHTASGNNGSFQIYARNRAGNNLIFKGLTMEAQGAAGGAADTNRWVFSFGSLAPSDYVVGEYAEMASHSNAANNGTFPITGVNQGGNNVVVYNGAGVVQGGAAGNVNTLRWSYVFATNPSASVNVGDLVETTDSTTLAARGMFAVKEVNRAAGTNIVVFNRFGATQASSGGSMYTLRMLVKLAAPIPDLTTASVITIKGTAEAATYLPYAHSNGDFQVLEVNRGGGSNYNAVISCQGPEQVGPGGRVVLEGKSVFTTRPSITKVAYGLGLDGGEGLSSTNAVLDADLKNIPDGTLLMAALTQIPKGAAKNVTLQLV